MAHYKYDSSLDELIELDKANTIYVINIGTLITEYAKQ